MTVPSDIKPLALEGKFHYINGQFVTPTGSDFVDTYNPATGQVLCKLPCASPTEVDQAVQAAHNSRAALANLSFEQRAQILEKLADLFDQNAKHLAMVESLDCGKALREAEGDMGDAAECIRYFAKLTRGLEQKHLEDKGTSGVYNVQIRWEPIGVFGCITPWNFPMLMAVQKVAAAIASGCPCVLKPSEYASFTAIELAAMLHQIPELPKGSFNLVIGTGAITGNALINHNLIRKVSFTGSIPTGKHIMKACAERMCPVHMELGGKSAMLVFDDCDLEKVIDWACMGIFWGAGQVCSATSRILVQDTIYQKFLARFKAAAETIKVGPGLEEGTVMGPLVSPQQYERVKSYLEVARSENLSVLCGGYDQKFGERPGFFMQPTAFVDVPATSRLWKEEIFGPVAVIRSFKTEEEALRLANDTEYGLGGAVMTSDKERATRVANALEAGNVWVNNSQPVIMAVGAPFGGFKQSGFGKECGELGLMEYMQPKAIIRVPSSHCEEVYEKPSAASKI